MDGTGLQDRYSRGMGAAARVFGLPHDLFRQRGADEPVRAERLLLRLPAAFDGGDPGYRRPRGFERSLRGTFDVDCTQVGDYLVGPRGVLFVVSTPALLRPLCMLTNAVVSVWRASGAEAPGLNGYGGVREPKLRRVLLGWPADLSGGGDGSGGVVPDDSGHPRWTVLLPVLPVGIQVSDVVEDGEGRRYLVRAAERSEFGWRLNVRQAGV